MFWKPRFVLNHWEVKINKKKLSINFVQEILCLNYFTLTIITVDVGVCYLFLFRVALYERINIFMQRLQNIKECFLRKRYTNYNLAPASKLSHQNSKHPQHVLPFFFCNIIIERSTRRSFLSCTLQILLQDNVVIFF